MVQILVVGNHAIVREGLRALIETEPGLELVGEARNGHEAVIKARSVSPDVILMDLDIPGTDGLEAIRQIKRENEKVQILVLSFYSEDARVTTAIDMGAAGYVLKDASPQELLCAIRKAASSQPSLRPSTARTANLRQAASDWH